MPENDNSQNTQNLLVGGALGILIALAFAWLFIGGGMESQTAKTRQQIQVEAARNLEQIEREVANDAVRQYEIAKRNGSAIDAYVQAGLVSAAFLQAEDEPNYRKWKRIEEREARRAGMPGS